MTHPHEHPHHHHHDHDDADLPPFAGPAFAGRRRAAAAADPDAAGTDRGRGPRFSRRDPGFGGPWWAGAGRGFGPGLGRFGGGRRRRGDVRAAIITLLGEEPMHGYQIIQEITERSSGRWQPSPGSVYPTLQALEDEGVVRAEEREGKRVFALTDEGRERLAELAERERAPWDLGEPDVAGLSDIREQIGQLAAAFAQVMQAGSPAQRLQARSLLVETRKGLYAILAADDPEPAADAGGDTGAPAAGSDQA
jgi:DNA-binding PadR family transcriptional regulator